MGGRRSANQIEGHGFRITAGRLCWSGNGKALLLSHQLFWSESYRYRRPLQRALEDWVVLQVNQAKSKGKNLSGNFTKCRSHPIVDRAVRLSPVVVFEIQSQAWHIIDNDTSRVATQLFERRPLIDLLKPPDKIRPIVSPQLLLWNWLWDSTDISQLRSAHHNRVKLNDWFADFCLIFIPPFANFNFTNLASFIPSRVTAIFFKYFLNLSSWQYIKGNKRKIMIATEIIHCDFN